MISKEKLRKYKPNKRELESIEKQIEKLEERLQEVPEVSVKVQKSGDDFPYIEGHMTVIAAEPHQYDDLKKRINKKKIRKAEIEAEIIDVDKFISSLPDGVDKQIFEFVYLEGMSQAKAAEAVDYTQARVSQIINGYMKDL